MSEHNPRLPPTALKTRPRPSIAATDLTNALSMSDPLTAPATASTSVIKSHGVDHVSNSTLPASQARTNPIISEGKSSGDKQSDQSIVISPPPRHVRRAATFDETSPLLSERESIFATHYLPSDSNDDQTPRMPASEGADDVAGLPQDLATTMELALPFSPPHSSPSFRTLLPSTKSRWSHLANNAGQQNHTTTTTVNTTPAEGSRGTIHTIRRVASEGQPGKQILQLRVTDPKNPPTAGNRSLIGGGREMLDTESDDEEALSTDIESGHVQWERESPTKEHFRQAGSQDRSSSRGRALVEKSIEATLPNRDLAKNVRARKSSHLMGIFKHTAPSELKRRDAPPSAVQTTDDEEEGNFLPFEDTGSRDSRPDFAISEPRISPIEESSRRTIKTEIADRLAGVHLGDVPSSTHPNTSAVRSHTPNGFPYMPSTEPMPEYDPYFRKRDEAKHNLSGGRTPVPAKLLEDIRRHHNVTRTSDGRALLSHSLPPLDETNKSKQLPSRQDARMEDIETREDEAEEHISSAVYFPHPEPAEEDIERSTSPGQEHRTEPNAALPSQVIPSRKPEHHRTLSDAAPPEHIDISVKFGDEENMFHGDYMPTEEIGDDNIEHLPTGAVSETSLDGSVGASESEFSSDDELSDACQAEEGQITLTSKPLHQRVSQIRKRTPTTAAPKGAVLLEPYSHQVGGHSTMFRFSRQAVCKQLNNRENEFYERIEQRHPEMLRFLPRLVVHISCDPTFVSNAVPSELSDVC